MNQAYISKIGSSRLLIFFAGWAMDEKPFEGLSIPGYDSVVIWDYSDEKLSTDFLKNYKEICIIAWSYGVYFAGRFIERHKDLPITARIAVNGTLYPVDDIKGIPYKLFEATLSALSEQSVMKFYRRMCGSGQIFSEFQKRMPQRNIKSLSAELEAIGNTYSHFGTPACNWDFAFISKDDRIFSAQAQREAWKNITKILELECGHLPDFQEILNKSLILKDGVSDAFAKALQTYESNAPIQQSVALHLSSLISNKAPFTGGILEIGCGSGFLTRELQKMLGNDASLTLIDVTPIDSALPGHHIQADAELQLLQYPDNSLSAIVSSSAVQWFNSPVKFFENAHRILKPGGLLAIAVYGESTFKEITELDSPSRTFSREYLMVLIPEGFNVEICEESEYLQDFTSARELLRHFRLTGVAPVNKSAKSAVLARKIIQSKLSHLTYNPIFLLLTKKKCCNFVT